MWDVGLLVSAERYERSLVNIVSVTARCQSSNFGPFAARSGSVPWSERWALGEDAIVLRGLLSKLLGGGVVLVLSTLLSTLLGGGMVLVFLTLLSTLLGGGVVFIFSTLLSTLFGRGVVLMLSPLVGGGGCIDLLQLRV